MTGFTKTRDERRGQAIKKPFPEWGKPKVTKIAKKKKKKGIKNPILQKTRRDTKKKEVSDRNVPTQLNAKV